MAGTIAASPKVASTVGLKDVVIAELTEDTEETLTYVQRTFTKRAVKQDGSRYYKVWCCRGRRNGNGCKNPNVLDEKLQEETRSAERYFVTRLGEIVKTT